MRPTSPGVLLAWLITTGALVWGALRIAESRGSTPPALPWAGPLGIAFLAAAVLVSTIALRRRLRGSAGTKPPQPLGVARMAVLGKASSHVGAILAGGYAGYLLMLLPSLDIGARRERAVVAAVAVLAGAVLTLAGLFLERSCRVGPRGDDIDSPSAPA